MLELDRLTDDFVDNYSFLSEEAIDEIIAQTEKEDCGFYKMSKVAFGPAAIEPVQSQNSNPACMSGPEGPVMSPCPSCDCG